MSENTAAYFPLFVTLQQKEILVFGGGTIASRRVMSLLEFGADITVIAPEHSQELSRLAAKQKKQKLVLEQRCYQEGEIKVPYLVLAATNDIVVNDKIYEECKAKGILVNVASDQSKSDFFFPGIVVESPLVIGITASGQDHKKAQEITQKIRKMLKDER